MTKRPLAIERLLMGLEGPRVMAHLLYADTEPHVERRTPEQIAREPGYYWVNDGYGWSVSEWTGHQWFACGSEVDDYDDPKTVGPRIIEPEA